MERDVLNWRRAQSNPPPECLGRLWQSASTRMEQFRPDGNIFCCCQVTEWSDNEMKGLGRVIVLVFTVTIFNPLASIRIPFPEARSWVKSFVYLHRMAQYQYHTEAMIEYMQIEVEEFHRQKDVFSRIGTSKCSKKISETLNMQLTLNQQEEWESDPAWNNLSAAVKHCQIDADKLQIEAATAQHLANESDFNFVKMHLLTHCSDHIRQIGNLIDVSSEHADKAMMDLEQRYWQ